jgi:hypothetical protein
MKPEYWDKIMQMSVEDLRWELFSVLKDYEDLQNECEMFFDLND